MTCPNDYKLLGRTSRAICEMILFAILLFGKDIKVFLNKFLAFTNISNTITVCNTNKG